MDKRLNPDKYLSRVFVSIVRRRHMGLDVYAVTDQKIFNGAVPAVGNNRLRSYTGILHMGVDEVCTWVSMREAIHRPVGFAPRF